MHLAEIFCDHMVLQRDKEICIFGYGKGEGIIEFLGEKHTFTSDDDKFCVYLPPKTAGGPYEMQVTLNGNTTVLTDIMIGDVYIAAGQSNIEFTLAQTQKIDYYNNTDIRFFTEPHNADEQGNLIHNQADWFSCVGDKVNQFSAIGYYFANELQSFINVPIGIISCSKGASRVDAWTAPEYITTKEYQKMQEVRHNDYHYYKFNHDSWTYKNKLTNIIPFANSGVLWYQGESNRGNAEAVYYSKMLEVMINNWRQEWNDNLPFYLVQLMPYNEDANIADWAKIRSQQELASKTIPNTYMVTLVNTGEENEIHPQKKKTVACELANAVKNIQFGLDIEYCGPILEGYSILESGLELHFSHADGLSIKGDKIFDLHLFDKNNKSITFNERIKNKKLCLECENVHLVSKITLGYSNAPKHNLYNSSGFLASPFCLEIEG